MSTAVFAMAMLALCGTGVAAEEDVAVKEKVIVEEEESALAKQAQNPLANLVSLPTASNPEVLGSEKFSLGPTAVLFYGVSHWTMGFVVSNTWSVAGESDRADVNFLLAQWFLNYNLGHGWAVGTAPIITANW